MKTRPRSWKRETDDAITGFLVWASGADNGMSPGRPVGIRGITRMTYLIRPLTPFLECPSTKGWTRFELDLLCREYHLNQKGEWVTAQLSPAMEELRLLDPRSLLEMISSAMEKAAERILGRHCPDSHGLDKGILEAIYNRLGLLNGVLGLLRRMEIVQFDEDFWRNVETRLCDNSSTIGGNSWPSWWALLDPLWPLVQELDIELALADVPVKNFKIILHAQEKRAFVVNDQDAFAFGPGYTSTVSASLFFGKLATTLRQKAADKQKSGNRLSDDQLNALYAAMTLSHVYHAISLPPPAR